VSEELFALAQEQLAKNKHFAPRRTIGPTLLQGMLVCQQCGYALYRCSTRTSKHQLHYYRCLGSDGYRRLKGSVCTNRPIRQDYLDQFVWNEIIRLLEDPALVQAEIDRRQEVARNADPLRRREEELHREQTRLEKSTERLVTAYQEGLVTLPQLRHRMPDLRKQAQAIESELQSLEMAAVDQAHYLQLAENLAGFCGKLRLRADTLDVRERQQILRLLVKEVLVDTDTITLRHSIPVPQSGNAGTPRSNSGGPSGASPAPGYLLRKGSQWTSLRSPLHARADQPVLHHPGIQECPDELQQPFIFDPFGYLPHQFVVINSIEKFLQIKINHPAVTFGDILLRLCHRLMSRPSRPKTIAVIGKRPVPPPLQNLHHRLLDESVQR
jgi:site-specific DNA recombinase